ncbi:hypothetical protein J1N35_037600, partial [Gossypium stocksii]
MDEFEKVLDELALVDIKTDKGWFTWSNNRDGPGFVKERLDRFVVSASEVEKISFLSTEVVRQSCSDHDAILLDSVGCKPNNDSKDPRSEVVNNERAMSHVRRFISPEMNEVLMGHFTDKEIMDAFAQMDPRKPIVLMVSPISSSGKIGMWLVRMFFDFVMMFWKAREILERSTIRWLGLSLILRTLGT